jgi:hypothetical protein
VKLSKHKVLNTATLVFAALCVLYLQSVSSTAKKITSDVAGIEKILDDADTKLDKLEALEPKVEELEVLMEGIMIELDMPRDAQPS